jgi:isoleucyl-tRNA synthetase
MATVRDYVNVGLSQRAEAQIKVRQPLASVTIPTLGKTVDFESILSEELNVKSVKVGDKLVIDVKITPELKREGLMREVVRFVQNARKEAGLSVDDRIKLSLITDDDRLARAIDEHKDEIARETLAIDFKNGKRNYKVTVSIENADLTISLEKAI